MVRLLTGENWTTDYVAKKQWSQSTQRVSEVMNWLVKSWSENRVPVCSIDRLDSKTSPCNYLRLGMPACEHHRGASYPKYSRG